VTTSPLPGPSRFSKAIGFKSESQMSLTARIGPSGDRRLEASGM
jgi:hypothetical protein